MGRLEDADTVLAASNRESSAPVVRQRERVWIG
jgi:hypothetical protein